MEKAGGRPKSEGIWEHVTVLPGGKKVKCKSCGFVFAASANRIKSHIHRIEGKGIRICPEPEKIKRDLKEKEDLPDSQGLLTVDKSRDYSKPHETMLDCYMSPKTMWEGIKAIRQVNKYNEARHQERIKVGPFYVPNILNERDVQLIRYVFEHSSDRCKVFSSSRFHLHQSEFTTLRPQTHLDSWVINIFADILTDIEKRKESKPFNWYLPETFSRAAINRSSFVNFVENHNMRENYMSGDLKYCEKIFIPVHVEKNSRGHYYLYIIHMKNQQVEIWDSLSDSSFYETERDETTQKLLGAMENLFGNVIMFTEFDLRMATKILLQPNGYDCGIFVINYMQQSDNYMRQNPLFQFDSDKERLDLALKLLKNDLNGEKGGLYDKAARRYAEVKSEEPLDLCSIKSKWPDTCNTIIEDVGRGVYMEFDDFDDRDEKGKNVGLKADQNNDLGWMPDDDIFLSGPLDFSWTDIEHFPESVTMEEPAVALVNKGVADSLDLIPGFRFHPTEEEIIDFYLRKKVLDSSFNPITIGEVDLNKWEPWELPGIAMTGDKEWYFFCQIDRRMNRATDAGYWKAIGKDREICREDNLVGMKKTLVFYIGRAPKGTKTSWVMHEFLLVGEFTAKDEWVVCRIFKEIPNLYQKENEIPNSQRSFPAFFSITLPPTDHQDFFLPLEEIGDDDSQ